MAFGRTFMTRAIRLESWPMAMSERSRHVVPPTSSCVLALTTESVVIADASGSIPWCGSARRDAVRESWGAWAVRQLGLAAGGQV
jgi:hypothetical protein